MGKDNHPEPLGTVGNKQHTELERCKFCIPNYFMLEFSSRNFYEEPEITPHKTLSLKLYIGHQKPPDSDYNSRSFF